MRVNGQANGTLQAAQLLESKSRNIDEEYHSGESISVHRNQSATATVITTGVAGVTQDLLQILRRYRIIMLAGAVLYPLWSLLMQYSVPGAHDPIWQRGCVSLVVLGFLIGSYYSSFILRNITRVCNCLILCITAHYFYLGYANEMNAAYAVGIFITVPAVCACIDSRRFLVFYSLFVLALALPVLRYHVDYPQVILIMGLGTVFLVSYLSIHSRLAFIEALSQSEEGFRRNLQNTERTEQAHRDADRRYRGLFNSNRDGVVIYDMEGNCIDANPAYCQMLGYSLQEIKALHYRATTQILPRGYSESYEKELIRKDGSIFLVSMRGWIVKDEEGREVGYWGIARDITEKKQTEENLKRSQEQLLQSQKLDSLGQLAGGVAHDFNNLLAAIMGYAGILDGKIKDNPEASEMVGAIVRSAERGAEVTRQLLGFARRGQYQKKRISPNSIIEEARSMLSRSIEKTITIRFEPVPDLWDFEGDSTQIIQVLLNLGVNARDAMAAGGELVFGIKNVTFSESALEVKTLGLKPGNYIRVSVKDTGTGMSKDVQSKIFDPFFTTKEQGRGTGLGLSMAYGILQTHHGAIALRSEVGKGTTFHLYLPALPRRQGGLMEEDARQSNSDLSSLRGLCILIADDEEPLRDFCVRLLEARGAQCLTASNGLHAVDTFRKYPGKIDAVIMDIGMPKMNGIKAYQEIRKLSATVKIVFVTGYAENATIATARQSGDVDFLEKPFTGNALLDKLISHLRSSKRVA